MKKIISMSACLLSAFFASACYATVVEVRTVVGNFQVNLFDDATPQTVENFLEYVNAGQFANNTVHRTVPNFIVQMGGFEYVGSFPPAQIATGTPVNNEPVFSNVRGTIAMAKLGGNPDSATSQFFVNLNDNSGNLDIQNGGFSVFGQVLGDGMDVVDQIASITRFNFGGTFAEIPLRNYTVADANNGIEPTDDNLVIITDIVVIDSARITNPQLNPVRNTLINNNGGQQPPAVGGNDSGGGSLHLTFILALLGTVFARRLRRPAC
jgi:peptidyl-prolyl cis-trans isomerase A (cyclophilin A)